ncbi:hypothetical protein SDRG_13472 [Saprolegnia diclina VS20]|uniref:Uncharacterized protein n=1 Tax=Saprolegnia diclina (strain VS20) TaxID=1156394 RepID=T0Q5S4_SAPDV|nr:hypothetical protein SDRG_13472 [Saprolegnia diclina VS20]EQC28790.1 hypothetical protein SDRG_13472 [Saprolegnia diclina VS20]|eukprot:XP_008617785.1 hypothetical protein SDRG_13472 [Saprolegnia diclina VS20]
MLRVVPRSALEGPTLPTHRTGCVHLCAGAASVLLSLAAGLYYLALLTPILANDLFWPQYNVSGYEAFLIDLTNLALKAHDETPLDLLGPAAVLPTLYNSASGSVNVPATYARSLLLGSYTSIEHAVLALRHLDASGSLWICSQYCWVDFAHVFEIAHTSARQTRCAQRYATNAAAYVESVLRNVDFAAFLANYGGPGNLFTMGLQTGLEESAYGRQWLTTTGTALSTTTFESEVAYWRQCGLTSFALPWQNSYDAGIQETISIRNAIGIAQDVLIKNVPYRMATWTTINLNWFFYNDVYYMQLCNQSLIANTTNYFLTAPPCALSSTGDFEGYMGLNNFGTDYINQTGLVHYTVGPFLSIDALYIAIPSVVSTAYSAFEQHLFEQLRDPQLWKTFLQLETLTVNPTPPTWQGPDMLYYGGNLLCLYGAPQTYVQTMFSFYDNCDRQVPAELDLSPPTLLFALAMTTTVAPNWNASTICALQTSAASVPGVVDAIVPLKSSACRTLSDDAVTSVMAGILPIAFGKKILTFNVLLGTLESSQSLGPLLAPDVALHDGKMLWLRHVMALAGAVYMLLSISASVSYIGVSRTLLGNDLVWSDFNMTGAHAFLVMLFVQSSLLGALPTMLTSPSVNLYGSFNGSSSHLVVPFNYGAMLQIALSDSLETAVSGLRQTNGCHAPWLATAYCYVDLNKQWELANTRRRQQRCATSMTTNGAVYLETVLRNVPSDAWRGVAFDLAVGATLNETNVGRNWLASTTSKYRATVDITDEAAYWRTSGILSFEMQWQNYKHIGVLQTYTVTSAFGSVYPFTIQATNGSFRFPLQTSFKMYWGFGSDLTMLLGNHTYALSGTSLVRGSAAYAYQNASSLESMLFLNRTLTAPLDEGLALVRGALGPFGSVDLQYVAMPASVQALLRSAFLSIAAARVASEALQDAFDAVPPYLASPVPPPWLAADFYTLGGSPLCPTVLRNSAARIALGLTEMFVSHNQCHKTSVSNMLEPSATHVLVAAALLPRDTNWTGVCALDPQDVPACLQATAAASAFWSLCAQRTPEKFEAAVTDVMALEIQLFQFGAMNQTAPATLYTYDIFNVRDPAYRYYAWIYIYDWLLGKREVVRFAGDRGSWTLLSGRIVYAISSVATNEFPTNYATYAQAANDYVMFVGIGLAACTWMYIAISRGRVEGRNMLSLHSVGSVVWVGRPLLLLRSLTAIAILSTSTLRLSSLGPFAAFVSATPPWYTTLLAASEVTWLGAIVVDLCLPLTRELTRHFTLLNNVVVYALRAARSQ